MSPKNTIKVKGNSNISIQDVSGNISIHTNDEKLDGIDNKINNVSQLLESLSQKSPHQIQRDWIRQIREDIFSFKPRTALNHLNIFEQSLISDNLIDNKTEAEISYLKGICNYEMGKSSEGAENYLNAYSKFPNYLLYQEKALRVYVDKQEDDKAFKLIEDIFKQDTNNPTAWASKIFIEDGILEEKLKQVPSIIFDIPQNYQRFKSRLAGYYTKNIGDWKILNVIFEEELNKKLVSPNKITLDNKSYWLLIANLKIVNISLGESLTIERVNPAIKNNLDLKDAVEFMDNCLRLMGDWEKPLNLIHYKFYLLFGKYCLNEKVSDALAIYNLYNELSSDDKTNYQVLTTFSLAQTKQFDNVIEVTYDESSAHALSLSAKAYAYFSLGLIEDAVRSSNVCFEKLEKIDVDALVNFITLQLVYTQDQSLREEQFIKFQDKFIEIPEKQIANLISYWDIFTKEERKRQLLEIKDIIGDQGEEIHSAILAQFFFNINEFELVIELIQPHILLEKETLLHELYIASFHFSHLDDTKLLNLLENWRNKGFSLKEDFLFWEICLLHFTLEWEQIYLLSQIGIDKFPDNINFYFNNILAALRLNQLQEVEKRLQEVATKLISKLDEDLAVAFSQLAIEAFLSELAIKILFPFAKNESMLNARKAYFHFFTLAYQNLENTQIDKVTIDSAVLVEREGKRKLLWINQNSIKAAPYNLLLEKKEGEVVIHQESFGTSIYKILKILHPYEGLNLEIYKAIQEDNAIGFGVKSIQAPNEDIEGFNRLLIQTFGESGTLEENRVESVYGDYAKRKVGFSAIVNMNFNDPISTYYSLINDSNRGLVIFPKDQFKTIQINPNDLIVVDFTSLLLFFELYRKLKLKYPNKFIVSKFLLEKIKLDILEIKLKPETNLSVKINSKGVTPYIYPEGIKESQLRYFEELMSWCLDNCIFKTSRKKLKILGGMYAKGDGVQNENMQEIIDTLFIREELDTFIVSDNLSIYELFYKSTVLVSTEYYLNCIFSENFEISILPEILRMNYKGLNISPETLKGEFEKYLLEEQNLYIQCLKNLITSNPVIAVNHIFDIYNLPILINQKQLLAQQVWLNFLSEIKLSNQTMQALKNLLQLKFRFLPHLLEFVFQDLTMSYEKLRYYY